MKKRRTRRLRTKRTETGRDTHAVDAATAVSPRSPQPAASRLRHHALTWAGVFGTTFWVMATLAAAAGAMCWIVKGPEVFRASFAGDLDLLLFLAPRFGAGMLIASFVAVLLPRERVARYVGETAGLKAVGIATAAGGLTPGGPMTSFPLVRALRDAGTGRSALVAYVTSWSTMGFQRILNWELPLLGPELTLLRLASSLPLPIVSGMFSRLLPSEPEPAPSEATRDAR